MNNNKRKQKAETCNIITDKEWADRHFRDGEGWVENYWRSKNQPHRLFLIEKICKYAPIHSLLEIGCASGPNLYRIAQKFPDAEVRGIDINPVAVQKGNEWFEREGITNVKIEVGKAQELEQFADNSFDIVLTDAVLIYISPDEIKQVASEMLRIGKVLILNEWHLFNKLLALLLNEYYYLRIKIEKYLLRQCRFKTLNYSFKPKPASLGFFVGHWARDYRVLFGNSIPKDRIHITKLPKELWNDKRWQRWGAVIEVAKNQ